MNYAFSINDLPSNIQISAFDFLNWSKFIVELNRLIDNVVNQTGYIDNFFISRINYDVKQLFDQLSSSGENIYITNSLDGSKLKFSGVGLKEKDGVLEVNIQWEEVK